MNNPFTSHFMKFWYCPDCGHKNSIYKWKCEKCGKEVA